MTREIRFRAWDVEKKEMFFPSSISWKDGFMWVANVHGDNRYETAIEKSELMQSTGLKDKNGAEIFEGDILKSEEGVGAVAYDGNGFWCSFELPRHRSGNYFPAEIDREIIGNIYEHPDLVKEASK